MVTVLIILGYAIIGFFEVKPLIKKKEYKELIVYLSLFSVAFVVSVLLSLGVKIPSPAEPIAKIVEAVIGKQQ